MILKMSDGSQIWAIVEGPRKDFCMLFCWVHNSVGIGPIIKYMDRKKRKLKLAEIRHQPADKFRYEDFKM